MQRHHITKSVSYSFTPVPEGPFVSIQYLDGRSGEARLWTRNTLLCVLHLLERWEATNQCPHQRSLLRNQIASCDDNFSFGVARVRRDGSVEITPNDKGEIQMRGVILTVCVKGITPHLRFKLIWDPTAPCTTIEIPADGASALLLAVAKALD